MSNQQGAKITVHWLNKSRGQRVVWLLEELGLEYDIAVHKRDENKRAGPELKAIHPLGKSPCVTIRPANSEKDIVIAESETIMEYICDHFGKELVPKRYPEGQEGVLGAETEEWMRYKFLMDYTEGSLFTILILALVTGNIKRPRPLLPQAHHQRRRRQDRLRLRRSRAEDALRLPRGLPRQLS